MLDKKITDIYCLKSFKVVLHYLFSKFVLFIFVQKGDKKVILKKY